MKLSDAYISLATRLQESVSDLAAASARIDILRLLVDEKAFPLVVQATEAATTQQAAALKLTESVDTLEPILLRESKADYEIKLIAPGKGSSAFYPAEVLKRDGPKVFGAGTHVYLNHPTAAEESARPEGDVANLAGVLTTQAQYHESHAKGAGLYARMKVFADHAQMVEEKAPHVGMSIRAAGIAEAGKVRDGVPVLKELTRAESVDVVTRAGAGGMILTEAARGATQEASMAVTEADVQRLVEAGVKAALAVQAGTVAVLEKRALRGDAREEATRLLEAVTLPPASKGRVIDSLLERDIPLKDGALDREKFKALVEAAAKSEGAYLTALMGDGARPIGLGQSVGTPVVDMKEAAERRKQAEEAAQVELAEAKGIFEDIGLPPEVAEIAARGRVA